MVEPSNELFQAQDFMTLPNIIALGAVVVFGSSGCERSEGPAPSDERPVVQDLEDAARRAAQPVRDARQEVHEALIEGDAALRDAADRVAKELGPTKEQFTTASRRRLDRADRELESLLARAEAAGTTVDAKVEQARQNAERLARDVDNASEESWDEAKMKFAEELARLEAYIHKSHSRLERGS